MTAETADQDQGLMPPGVAVVIPCYRERDHVLDVLASIGAEVSCIFVVDDRCPDGTGKLVEERCRDPRVKVIFNQRNLGVGGATVAGYRAALTAGADIVVKLDGDGQMDPRLIPELIRPIERAEADYAKGNRLHRYQAARGMPAARLVGNMVLTLMCKLSSGYWNVMDPTNGFTAIHAAVLRELPLDELPNGFFFETEMLFRLGGLNAVVRDVPMQAKYGAEKSHLSIRRVLLPFLFGHCRNFCRRIVDTYFLRDLGLPSVELVAGLALTAFGAIFGAVKWHQSIASGIPATAGTVVLSALPVIVGVQLLLAFLGHDTRRVPERPIHPLLSGKR